MTVPVSIACATPETLGAAIAFLTRDRSDHAEILLDHFASGALCLEDFILATRGDTILGAILAERLGGAQASLGLPVAEDPLIARQLVAACVQYLECTGQRVLHVLADDQSEVEVFHTFGFVETTELIYFARTLNEADLHIGSDRLTFRAAVPDDTSFAEMIAETFEDSLDLPELIGLFDVSEVQENFRKTANDPPLWWSAEYHGFPCGVLLLATLDSGSKFELTYMGLIPTARGRGLGIELARNALRIAASLGGTHIELSCDERNRSARQLYDQLGFVETHRRRVLLKISPRSEGL